MKIQITACQSDSMWYYHLYGFKFNVHSYDKITYQLDGEPQLYILKNDACIVEEDKEIKIPNNKHRFYVATREGGRGTEWEIGDRSYPEGYQIICRSTSRSSARMIVKSLNMTEMSVS
jgi:hypothetical protein